MNGMSLHEGDGAGASKEESLKLLGGDAAEVLIFDLK